MYRVVVFDWGDTVMRVFPEYAGPMACWPRVEAVPGIEEALQALHSRCCLVLATNAAESGKILVLKALQRVGLQRYFDAVFTARELGVRKPDPAFFRQVLTAMACAPCDAVVVGDDYQIDVVGAKKAGLRAIWFNPAGLPCPMAPPIHGDEVQLMADLLAAVERLSARSRSQ